LFEAIVGEPTGKSRYFFSFLFYIKLSWNGEKSTSFKLPLK
jgi:hypothetical protein